MKKTQHDALTHREASDWMASTNANVLLIREPARGWKTCHNEDIFRLVTRGSLILRTNPDEMEFHEGEWFVVREGTAYEIETRTGYTALAGYKMACKTQH